MDGANCGRVRVCVLLKMLGPLFTAPLGLNNELYMSVCGKSFAHCVVASP